MASISRTLALVLRGEGFRETGAAIEATRTSVNSLSGDIPQVASQLDALANSAARAQRVVRESSASRAPTGNVTGLADQFNRAGQAASDLAGNINKIPDATKGVERSVSTFGRITTSIRGATAGATAGVAGIGRLAASVGLAGLAFGAGAVAIDGFVKTVQLGVAAAREHEAAIQRLNIGLRSTGTFSAEAARDYKRFAQELAASSDQAQAAVIAATASIAQLGQVAGGDLKRTTAAAVDLAAALGVGLSTTADALAKAAQGSTGGLSRLGIVIDETVPKAERLATALQLIEARFGGAGAESIRTFSGALAQLQNTVASTAASLTAGLTDGFTRVQPGINSLLAGLQRIDFGFIPDNFDEAITRLEARARYGFARVVQRLVDIDPSAALQDLEIQFRATLRGGDRAEIVRALDELTRLRQVGIEVNDKDLVATIDRLSKQVQPTLEARVEVETKAAEQTIDRMLRAFDATQPLVAQIQLGDNPDIQSFFRSLPERFRPIDGNALFGDAARASDEFLARLRQGIEAGQQQAAALFAAPPTATVGATGATVAPVVAQVDRTALDQFRADVGRQDIPAPVKVETPGAEDSRRQIEGVRGALDGATASAKQLATAAAPVIKPTVDLTEAAQVFTQQRPELEKLVQLEAKVRATVPSATIEQLRDISQQLGTELLATDVSTEAGRNLAQSMREIIQLFDRLAGRRVEVLLELRGAQAFSDASSQIDALVEKSKRGISLVSPEDLEPVRDLGVELGSVLESLDRAIATGKADVGAEAFNAALRTADAYKRSVDNIPGSAAEAAAAVDRIGSRRIAVELLITTDRAEQQLEAFADLVQGVQSAAGNRGSIAIDIDSARAQGDAGALRKALQDAVSGVDTANLEQLRALWERLSVATRDSEKALQQYGATFATDITAAQQVAEGLRDRMQDLEEIAASEKRFRLLIELDRFDEARTELEELRKQIEDVPKTLEVEVRLKNAEDALKRAEGGAKKAKDGMEKQFNQISFDVLEDTFLRSLGNLREASAQAAQDIAEIFANAVVKIGAFLVQSIRGREGREDNAPQTPGATSPPEVIGAAVGVLRQESPGGDSNGLTLAAAKMESSAEDLKRSASLLDAAAKTISGGDVGGDSGGTDDLIQASATLETSATGAAASLQSAAAALSSVAGTAGGGLSTAFSFLGALGGLVGIPGAGKGAGGGGGGGFDPLEDSNILKAGGKVETPAPPLPAPAPRVRAELPALPASPVPRISEPVSRLTAADIGLAVSKGAGASTRARDLGSGPVAPSRPSIRPIEPLADFARASALTRAPVLVRIDPLREERRRREREARIVPTTQNQFHVRLNESSTLLQSFRNGNFRRAALQAGLGGRG